MSLKIKLTNFILITCVLSHITKVQAETLSISSPYLPSKIQILDSEDLVTNVILSNISSPIYKQSPETSSPLKATKTSRTKDKDNEIWEVQYPNDVPISSTKKMNSSIIKNSISFLREYYRKQESYPTSDIGKSVFNIAEINFSDTSDGFTAKFKLKNTEANFLHSLNSMPIIDKNTAEIMEAELGKGTNLPLFGNFQIKENSPNSHYTLVRNNYFGLNSEKEAIQEVIIKKYENSESRMRSIRSGSVSIILAPTLNEIKDASSDPTLEIINSPFAKQSYKMVVDKKNDLDSNEIYDLQHLIIRKSLKTDNNFINFFELHSVILSVV